MYLVQTDMEDDWFIIVGSNSVRLSVDEAYFTPVLFCIVHAIKVARCFAISAFSP